MRTVTALLVIGSGPRASMFRIVFTLTRSGTWTIGATSLGANQLGSYVLTIECSAGTGGDVAAPIAKNVMQELLK